MFDIQVEELTVPSNYVLIDFESVQPKNLELLAEHPLKIGFQRELCVNQLCIVVHCHAGWATDAPVTC